MRIVGIGLRSPSRGRARPLTAAMKRRTHPGSHDHLRGARYQTAARPTRPHLGRRRSLRYLVARARADGLATNLRGR